MQWVDEVVADTADTTHGQRALEIAAPDGGTGGANGIAIGNHARRNSRCNYFN